MIDVCKRIEGLYGSPLLDPAGVLHVVAVWETPAGDLEVMKIGAQTPRSESDFFALNLARARADAIVTTGRILREEPDVRHALQGPAADALAEWRRRELDKTEPVWSAVISSGRGLDLDHPLFRSGSRVLIYTAPEGAALLEKAAAARNIPLLVSERPRLPDLIARLQGEFGAESISLEAGPSTVLPLYAVGAIDELMLSIFRGPELEPGVRGAAFPGVAELQAQFPFSSEPCEVQEASGPWQFRRFTRRPT